MKGINKQKVKMWKGLAGLFVLLLLFSMEGVMGVRADVLWEPEDNFYEAHRDDCEIVQRTYIANSEAGLVYSYKAPDNDKKVRFMPNGTKCFIDYVYQDGDNLWGVYTDFDKDETAWVWLNQFYVKYDYASFREEYANKIIPYAGEAGFTLTENTVLWDYPGSASNYTWQAGEVTPEYSIFQYSFTDEEGREWGFVGYMYGRRNDWICISDPENDKLPLRDIELPTIYDAVNDEEEAQKVKSADLAVPIAKGEFPWLPVILVAVVVAGSAVLLILFGRKKSGGNDTQ